MSRLPSIPAKRTNHVQTTAPVAGDFCYHAGGFYLIVVDCYSDWPTIIPMGRNITTSHLNAGLRELFSRTAILDIFWLDRGHQTSTPHYPQSNGSAEAAVKSMKRIIRAAWNSRCINEEKLCRALLQYRNMPSRKDGLLPAQKLYSYLVLGDIEKLRCRYDMRKLSQYNDIHDISCMVLFRKHTILFVYIHHPSKYIYSYLNKQHHQVKYFKPKFVYI